MNVSQTKLYGDAHADIAATLNNLAALYTKQNKFFEVE
jgi:hypothetical protein